MYNTVMITENFTVLTACVGNILLVCLSTLVKAATCERRLKKAKDIKHNVRELSINGIEMKMLKK